MHPDYRKRLLKLLADTDQACGLQPEQLTLEEQGYAELAEALRQELLAMRDGLEGQLRMGG